MNKVGGAIQGINHPSEFFAGFKSCSLFSDETRFGKELSEPIHNQLFRLFVDIGYKIGFPFYFDEFEVKIGPFAGDERTGCFGYFDNFLTNFFQTHNFCCKSSDYPWGVQC